MFFLTSVILTTVETYVLSQSGIALRFWMIVVLSILQALAVYLLGSIKIRRRVFELEKEIEVEHAKFREEHPTLSLIKDKVRSSSKSSAAMAGMAARAGFYGMAGTTILRTVASTWLVDKLVAPKIAKEILEEKKELDDKLSWRVLYLIIWSIANTLILFYII